MFPLLEIDDPDPRLVLSFSGFSVSLFIWATRNISGPTFHWGGPATLEVMGYWRSRPVENGHPAPVSVSAGLRQKSGGILYHIRNPPNLLPMKVLSNHFSDQLKVAQFVALGE